MKFESLMIDDGKVIIRNKLRQALTGYGCTVLDNAGILEL
jgi:hypothetical protein